jgi:hypothetical protein
MAKSGDPRADFQPVSAAPHADLSPLTPDVSDTRYDDAIAGLEKAFESRRATLDPETVNVLEQNLDVLDHAIEESRDALAKDPRNAYVSAHLADLREEKLALLGRAATLPGR